MQYLAWFELGRTELMRTQGVCYADLEKRGTMLPVSRVQIEYLQGAAYDELVDIATWVTSVRSRTIEFTYEASRADGEVLARGTTTLVSTNPEGRPRRMPEDVRSVLDGLLQEAA